MPRTDLTLRPAVPEDLEAVAELHTAARAAAYPAMPRSIHSPEETRAWVAGWDLSGAAVWVAESQAGDLLGYARSDQDWLDDLYVAPGAQGDGVGSALLEVVQAERPHGFCLWVFESNLPARRFYRARGLVELERTDGTGNEEQQPDLRMAWPGRDPLAFYRSLVDAVDAELGEVLNRRAAITAAIQPHKGSSGRDAEREREIACALARRAPALGEERLARILDTIISESLGAAGG